MPGFSIEPLRVPESLAGPGGADFRASVAVRNASEARAYGTEDVTVSAEEVFPNWQDAHQPKTAWSAVVDGRIVGRAIHETLLGAEHEVGWLDIDVHPEFEGRGIGRALADVVEAHARQLGEQKLLTYAVSSPAAGSQLVPPTGFGSVPGQNREVRFLLARGYRLEQVERASRLVLPVAEQLLAETAQDAATAAGTDYTVHTWQGSTPDHRLADLAVLLTRMSTDAPTAGLEDPEDVWTAERLTDHERRHESIAHTTLTAAVEHRPSGTLVAFNQLGVPRDRGRPVAQEDTLVLREHRGHRLGMLVKIANILQLQRERPGHPSILTWNAEENRYMLDVNEALGFTPIGYEGAWRLDL